MDEKIAIMTEKQNPWILRRAAMEIKNHYPGVTINRPERRELTYFVNYAVMTKSQSRRPGIKVGHFTHLEEGPPWRQVFIDHARICDYMTVTCDKTRDILLSMGVGEHRIRKIPYGHSFKPDEPHKVRFGVCGRTYPSGRKGEWMIEKAVEEGYEILAWGRGWPVPEENRLGDDPDHQEFFWSKINYLLVTSTNEGGPVPVIEAIARGIPVIAPNVGWCWDFPVIRFRINDWDSLRGVMYKLVHPPTWKQWADRHMDFFKEILTG